MMIVLKRFQPYNRISRLPLWLLVAVNLMAQLSGGEGYISVGVLSQYGRGVLPSQELSDTTGAPYIYSEHLLGITAGRGSWSLWTSLELSAAPRIGPPLTGLPKL